MDKVKNVLFAIGLIAVVIICNTIASNFGLDRWWR